MAVGIRGSSQQVANGSFTTFSLTVPAGTVATDVAYIVMAPSGTPTITGFTLIESSGTFFIYRRVCNGSEGPTFDGTMTAQDRAAICVVFSGVDTAQPEDTAVSLFTSGVSNSANTAPSITTNTAGAGLMCGWLNASANAGSWTPPGSMVERGDLNTASVVGFAVATEILGAAGATGTRTAVPNTARFWESFSFAVKEAIPATDVTPSTLVMPFAFPTPTITADGSVTPPVLVAPFVFPAPTVTATGQADPPVLVMPFVFPAPNVIAGNDTNPAALVMPFAFPTPTITADGSVTPPVLVMPFVFPTPTVMGDTVVSVPSTLVAPFVFPAPTVTASASPTPAPLVMPFAFPAPTVAAAADVPPAPVVLTFVFPTPTIVVSVGRSLDLQWRIFGSVGRSLDLEWAVYNEHRFVPTISDDDLLDLRFLGIRSSCFRYDLLNNRNNKIDEVNPVASPTIANDITRGIKRDMKGFALPPSEQAEVNTFADRIRPVMILENGSEYPLGVFLFAAASRAPHTYGHQFAGALVDQCLIVDQPSEVTIGFDTGTIIGTAIMEVLGRIAGLPVIYMDNIGRSLGSPISWPAGTSLLKIVNDLCALGGAYDLYFDNAGFGRIRLVPSDITKVQPAVYYVDGDCGLGTNVGNILEGTTIETDNLIDSPNRFVVIDSQAGGGAIVGIYDIPASAPNSFFNRNFRVPKVITEQGLNSSYDAEVRARTAAAQAAADYSWWSFQGIIDPRHDTYDILSVRGQLVREQKWGYQVQEGANMSHDVRLAFA